MTEDYLGWFQANGFVQQDGGWANGWHSHGCGFVTLRFWPSGTAPHVVGLWDAIVESHWDETTERRHGINLGRCESLTHAQELWGTLRRLETTP